LIVAYYYLIKQQIDQVLFANKPIETPYGIHNITKNIQTITKLLFLIGYLIRLNEHVE